MNGRCYLKKSCDFSLVHVNGSWVGAKSLYIKYLPNELGYTRFGIVASKKVGGAVVRNHVKRQIREVLRLQTVKAGFDIVIVSRPTIITEDFEHISRTVKYLLNKSDLLVG